MSSVSEMTQLLHAAESGQEEAVNKLLDVAYTELHKMAVGKMAGEKESHDLQPTALVHEAYLRLFGNGGEAGQAPHWNHRGHFFAAAAEAMRRILIENARRRQSQKRGGDVCFTTVSESKLEEKAPDEELLAVDEALGKLQEEEPALALVVKLRYFAGMTVPETAEALGVSARTVNRQWECARVWLFQEISEG